MMQPDFQNPIFHRMGELNLRERLRNTSSLFISLILHILLALTLGLFIKTADEPEDEITVAWVEAPAPRMASRTMRLKNPVPQITPERSYTVKGVQSPSAGRYTPGETRSLKADYREVKTVKPAGQEERFGGLLGTTEAHMAGASDVSVGVSANTGANGVERYKRTEFSRGGTTKSRPGGKRGLSLVQRTTTSGLETDLIGGIARAPTVVFDPLQMSMAVTSNRLEKETVIFLLDVSNSMEGNYGRYALNAEWNKKLRRAKNSIITSISRLRPENDSFNLMIFSEESQNFRASPVQYGDRIAEEVVSFIESLKPASHQKRTNLFAALSRALAMSPTRIILVSDGLPTTGVTGMNNFLHGIKAQNKHQSRIYTFAINLGNNPEARYLLTQLATRNGGFFRDDEMGHPRGISIGNDGNIYVADGEVRIFAPSGKRLASFGSLVAKITVSPQGEIHLLMYHARGRAALGVYDKQHHLTQFAGYGIGRGLVSHPFSVAASSSRHTYVTDCYLNWIWEFDRSGNVVKGFGSAGLEQSIVEHTRGDDRSGYSKGLHTYGRNGSEDGFFTHPMGIAIDSEDNIYVVDAGNKRVQIFDSQANFIKSFPLKGWGMEIAVEPGGEKIYVLTGQHRTGGQRVNVYQPDGKLVTEINVGEGTTDIDVDATGKIYALDFVYDRVKIFDATGKELGSFSTLLSR